MEKRPTAKGTRHTEQGMKQYNFSSFCSDLWPSAFSLEPLAYAAVTRDEDNAADGPFSSASYNLRRRTETTVSPIPSILKAVSLSLYTMADRMIPMTKCMPMMDIITDIGPELRALRKE